MLDQADMHPPDPVSPLPIEELLDTHSFVYAKRRDEDDHDFSSPKREAARVLRLHKLFDMQPRCAAFHVTMLI
jgi:hypothetical protein